jgi:hypothetical protein
MLRGHLEGILSWTKSRVSNGAVDGMNNKIKSISHRSFGFRTAENFIAQSITAALGYRCPSSANCTFWIGTVFFNILLAKKCISLSEGARQFFVACGSTALRQTTRRHVYQDPVDLAFYTYHDGTGISRR